MAGRPRGKIRRTLLLSALLAAGGCAADAELPDRDEVCSTPRTLAELPDVLSGASGVVISRTHPGVLWMHNNTEPAGRVFAVDSAGRVLATLDVPGTGNVDWEDLALSPCGQRECLYIADIGDNLQRRDDIGFLRVPEPAPSAPATEAPEWFPFAYPDGPQDAEALFVLPGEHVFVLSKGRNRAITLYRYPPPLRPGERVELQPLQQLSPGIVQLPDQVTGADATNDGAIIAVRTYSAVQLYRFAGDELHPMLEPPGIDLSPLDEPQGEGVAIGADGRILLIGERGLDERVAPLASLDCRLDALRSAP